MQPSRCFHSRSSAEERAGSGLTLTSLLILNLYNQLIALLRAPTGVWTRFYQHLDLTPSKVNLPPPATAVEDPE